MILADEFIEGTRTHADSQRRVRGRGREGLGFHPISARPLAIEFEKSGVVHRADPTCAR